MSRYRIASVPGDGIGREVVPVARDVLDAAATRFGIKLEWDEFDFSCERYSRTGRMMPDDGLDRLAAHDAVFFGAVGFPGVPDHISLWGLLVPIRRAFRQYVNLRPIRSLRGVRSPVVSVGHRPVDCVVVRENSEGEYSDVGGRLFRGTPGDMAVQESVFTRTGTERIMRYAFALACARRRRVASATKSNGIRHTMPFWDEVFDDVAADHPDVKATSHHVDALSAQFVQRPQDLDVVVASNLFGDILSDLAAAVIGGLGLAPSANLNPEGDCPSMFEPVHGSAPDLAGLNRANPLAQVWSGALMLEHLGQTGAARAVESAVETLLADEAVGTADLGGTASTTEVGEELVSLVNGRVR